VAIQKTEGIVLRNQDLRETSCIVTFYTKDYGKIKGVIKGVRGPRPQQFLNPQLFTLNEIVFYERKRGDFCTVSQWDLTDFFHLIRNDLRKTAYAAYFIELLDYFTPIHDKNEKAFEVLLKSLSFLSGPASEKRVARVYEIKIMDVLGLMPSFDGCAGCSGSSPGEYSFDIKAGGLLCSKCSAGQYGLTDISKGTVNFIRHVKKTEFPLVERIKVSDGVGREVEGLLRKFVDFHLERRLKSLEFLGKIGKTSAKLI
jgi:DNA repair protein RecO (recombination protein O)